MIIPRLELSVIAIPALAVGSNCNEHTCDEHTFSNGAFGGAGCLEGFAGCFGEAVKVKAEFVHKDIATYSIVGDPNKIVYHDFALVMKDAERLVATNGTQTVLLNDVAHGDSVKSAILPKGNYTIPANVRFIIPGKGLYDYREALESTDFYKSTAPEYKYASASSFKKIEHIRWIVEEGTTINVSAGSAICVQSMVVSIGSPWFRTPLSRS